MKWILGAAAIGCLAVWSAALAEDLPKEWIDPDTHHRVVRISEEPGSQSLYFNFNAYTPQNDKMVISTPKGIASFDFKTRALKLIVPGKVHLLFTGHKTRQVYYEIGDLESGASKTIYAADIDTGKSHQVAKIESGNIQSINADETLLGGVVEHSSGQVIGHDGMIVPKDVTKGPAPNGPDGKPLAYADAKESRMDQRLEAKIPMEIFTINIKTGERKIVTASTDWLNHLQFSPTDPGLLMYCHEGPWHKVDRLWLIRVDQADAKPLKLHTRTMNMEIAGHEWFSHDGKTIWYDLQTPRGEDFWVAGYRIADGSRTWYHHQRNEWSVHYNQSDDGTLFSGDGGDPEMVAHAPDGKWMYLFRPHIIADGLAGVKAPNSESLVHPGYFEAEKLVNLKDHKYKLEPNGRFSPDGKWLIFRSNMLGGASQVYAVEIAKAK
ncbi:oligogalacturonide lyase [Rhizomicrobium palustre]|uniref:Oligogalacturonide lyase n=1 Tax=Rhizomicrobium palustre TaxID=189966 RepID=A0A846N1W4_9PROT|nr:oligogalacturonate lyase family protein [Rhizomicrobium palustre]NIK89137.1 oligogalacturonide lyase [Rhizomicrobium palustre]